MSIKKGDVIKVEYTGTLDDGTVFDSTKTNGEPIEFEVGSGQIITGFDTAVEGMEMGDEKNITLEPNEAYGEPSDDLIKKIPRDQLFQKEKLDIGMVLLLSMPNGIQLPATIEDVSGESITINLNHPLAGKTLNFNLSL